MNLTERKNTIMQKEEWGRTWSDLLDKGIYPELGPYKIEWHKTLAVTLAKKIDFLKIESILECGCGNSAFGLEIANNYPHVSLTLSDICQSSLDYSEKLLNRYREIRKCNFYSISPSYIIEDMFRLSHQAGVFDLVINGGTLEHYADKEIRLLVIEMLRVVKSRGYVVVVVPNLRNFDINLYKLKLIVKNFFNNKLFKNLIQYGGNDERNINLRLFNSAVIDIEQIDSIIYLRHPIAIPRFIKRRKNIIFKLIERMLVRFGFNWAHIYVIKKK